MGDGIPHGLLRARCAVVFNTSNTTSVREQTVFGDPLELLWRNCVFGLCGVPAFHRRTFNVVVASTGDERKQWLTEVAASVSGFFPRGQGSA